jgi:hypothetical protein
MGEGLSGPSIGVAEGMVDLFFKEWSEYEMVF